jgi:hypothetical protein
MKKVYTQPEVELRKIISAEAVSASTGDDNEVDASEAWPGF